MRIIKTDIYRFSIPMKPFTIATGTMDFAQNVFIRIFTDTDIYGVGECSAFPMIVGETQDTCISMAKDFAGILKGRDPLEISDRMHELHSFIAYNSTIKSAFDMALFDIAAKSKGLPLYRFLKGSKRPIETDITIGIGTPEVMEQQALELKKHGATILKVKLGKGSKEDLERISRIRRIVGPDLTIRVDANQGWNYQEAVDFLTNAVGYDIEFCEQPIRKSYDDSLPALRAISPIKIMADESCFDRHDARKLIKNNSCDFLNIKFSKSGGILEALEIYETAREARIPCMIGGMLESRLALSAKVHFAYACPEIKFYDLDTCMLGHLADPTIGGVQFRGFHLDLADSAGIGADVDDDFLATCEKWTI